MQEEKKCNVKSRSIISEKFQLSLDIFLCFLADFIRLWLYSPFVSAMICFGNIYTVYLLCQPTLLSPSSSSVVLRKCQIDDLSGAMWTLLGVKGLIVARAKTVNHDHSYSSAMGEKREWAAAADAKLRKRHHKFVHDGMGSKICALGDEFTWEWRERKMRKLSSRRG